jgi:HSP20 family protein
MAKTDSKADVELRKTDTILGDAVNDWLSAERELIWKPAVEVRQQDGRLEILTALPGVDARNIDVQVTPDDVLIKATVKHEHTTKDGDVHVCELERGNAFRSIHLPSTIDANSAKAEYRDGMLRVTAAVVKAATPQRVAVKAA